jgi:octaprenyl-diphosphate synthase
MGKLTGTESGRTMSREEVFGLVQAKLELVGERFDEGLGSNVEIVSAMGSHISESGGKRLRPALLLLSSGLCDYRGTQDVLFGAVFEFIHTATLIHDDIIDSAETRRGRESVNHRWGNHLTVLMGDHLYIRAMHLAIEAGDLRILDLLAKITLRMIEGEMMQGHQNGRINLGEKEHLEIVERKTASLFSGCCRVPAILAGLPVEQQHALGGYGLDLGMAFQLIDDLLDLTADEKTLGKPTTNDLREGKLTLPLICLLKRGDPSHAEMVRKVIEDRGFGRVSRESLLSALGETGCLEEARAAAVVYVQRARGHLASFPDGLYKDALLSIPEFVLERDR